MGSTTYMMKLVALTICIILSNISGTAQTEMPVNQLSSTDSIFTDDLIDLIFEKVKDLPDNAELALALIVDGQEYYYGVTRSKDTVHTIENSDRIFEIGSITKVFTSTILAQLVQEDVLNLDDKVGDFLPFDLNDSIKISLSQLATHTSGLPRMPSNLDLSRVDFSNPYKHYGETELIDYLSQEMNLQDEPGTVHNYSNLGVGTLGFVLTKIVDLTYEQLIQERLFQPYNMKHSTTSRQTIRQPLVPGINDQGETVSNWDMNVLVGAGGVLSTARDLSKFALAQFQQEDEAMALTRKPMFEITQNRHQGLGWLIFTNDDQSKWYWHNGGTGGYTSSLLVDIANKNAIIILSNISGFSRVHGKIDELAFELMSMIAKN